MSDPEQKFTGREYTVTVAWLVLAVLFIPSAVIALHPGYLALLLATASSAICLAGARLTWKKSSRLSIPSIANALEHRNPTHSSREVL